MPKAQKHCKLHDFYAWTVPKKQEKWPKIDQKTPNKNLQNASSNFTLFFPTPNPQKRENPSRLKDFRGGSAAGARPWVAKAMLSFPHYTARHRRIKGLRPLPPTPGLALHLRMAPTIGVSALGAGATGADSEQRNWENKNILPIVGNEMLQWMWYTAMWSPD